MVLDRWSMELLRVNITGSSDSGAPTSRMIIVKASISRWGLRNTSSRSASLVAQYLASDPLCSRPCDCGKNSLQWSYHSTPNSWKRVRALQTSEGEQSPHCNPIFVTSSSVSCAADSSNSCHVWSPYAPQKCCPCTLHLNFNGPWGPN